jgi:acetyl esterase/lipase
LQKSPEIYPSRIIISFVILFNSLISAACSSKSSNIQSTEEFANSYFTPIPAESSPGDISPSATPLLIDLVYCTSDDGVKLTMDVYKPSDGSGPFPTILYIHGGGWTSGDKTDGVGLFFREELLRRGYIFTSINYRLAPKYSFPAPILDAKCAVRFLRENSEELDINPDRIGVLGGSAGGQLAALIATSQEMRDWDVGEFEGQSSQVAAVVDMFGPSDLLRMFQKSERLGFLQIFGAASSDDPILKTFSPVTYIDPTDPPFLILHGDQDLSIPLEQSQILYDTLIKNGVPVEMIIVKNAGHSFISMGARIKPNMIELSQKVGEFFDQHLK